MEPPKRSSAGGRNANWYNHYQNLRVYSKVYITLTIWPNNSCIGYIPPKMHLYFHSNTIHNH